MAERSGGCFPYASWVVERREGATWGRRARGSRARWGTARCRGDRRLPARAPRRDGFVLATRRRANRRRRSPAPRRSRRARRSRPV